MTIAELHRRPCAGLLGTAALFALGPAVLGCTTPLPLLPIDAGGRADAPSLDAPGDLVDVPPDPDAPSGLDAPGTDSPVPVDAAIAVDAPGSVGSSCVDGAECVGGFCVDGVCCASACGGACQACAAALTGAANGTCAPVAAGTDPADECPLAPPSSCATDGTCDGAGACRRYAAGTPCSTASCSGSAQLLPARTCDGAGLCQVAAPVSCGSYRCRGGACLTSCSGGIDCAAGASCMGGSCVGDGDPGDACSSPMECRSGFCADAHCCDTACTGLCSRCDGNGTSMPSGTCAPIECSDPDDECSGLTPVCTTGVCGTMLSC